MGRVRRYKKIKACDPFAKKRKGAVEGEKEYDLPPDGEDDFEGEDFGSIKPVEAEDLTTRKSRQQERRWEREVRPSRARAVASHTCLLSPARRSCWTKTTWPSSSARRRRRVLLKLSCAATRALRGEEERTCFLPSQVVIESKRQGESAKDFKRRLREDGKKILIETAAAHSSTKQRGKEYLKQKKWAAKEEKRKKKEAAAARRSPEDGDWPVAEKVRFGDRVDAPPDLTVRPRGADKRERQAPAPPPEPAPKRQRDQERAAGEKRSLKAARATFAAAAAASKLGSWESGF